MTICPKCQKEPVEQIYHAKNRVGHSRPVGTPGKHVTRMLCDCGCKSVEFFFVIDYDKSRTRATDNTPRLTMADKNQLLKGQRNVYA